MSKVFNDKLIKDCVSKILPKQVIFAIGESENVKCASIWIKELEAKNKQLKEETESHLAMINMLEIRSGELIQESKQQEKLLIEACSAVECSEDFPLGALEKENFLNKPEIKELLERKSNNN